MKELLCLTVEKYKKNKTCGIMSTYKGENSGLVQVKFPHLAASSELFVGISFPP